MDDTTAQEIKEPRKFYSSEETARLEGFEVYGIMDRKYEGWVYYWRSAKWEWNELVRSSGWHRMYKD